MRDISIEAINSERDNLIGEIEKLQGQVEALRQACQDALDDARSRLPCDALGLTGEAFLDWKLNKIAWRLDSALNPPKPGYIGNVNGIGCDPDVP